MDRILSDEQVRTINKEAQIREDEEKQKQVHEEQLHPERSGKEKLPKDEISARDLKDGKRPIANPAKVNLTVINNPENDPNNNAQKELREAP